MKYHLHQAFLVCSKEIDLLDVTHDVKRALRESGILNGLLTVYVPGTAAGVVVLENDPGIRQELKNLLVSFVPDTGVSRPSRRSGSGRDEAHLRAALLSSSVSIPIKDGRPMMNAWQEVIVYDFDDKPGRRDVFIQVMGDGPAEKK